MTISFREKLRDLSDSHTQSVMQAILIASLEELSEVGIVPARQAPADRSGSRRGSRRGAGRLARRSTEGVAQVIDRIVELVGRSPGGLRAEVIRQKLGMQAKELPRPLKAAIASGRLSKSGHKRATVYSVGRAKGKKARKTAKAASAAVVEAA